MCHNLFRVLALSGLLFASLSSAKDKQAGATLDYLERPITEDVFYFILVDRFENADRANDKGFDERAVDAKDSARDILRHGYWPENKGYYHGGDFKGIIKRLDYLQKLGITAIWLSPIMKNMPVQGIDGLRGSSAGYHGYWIYDFTTVDPHLGTEEDFKRLVDAAHKRNIKVFLDVITNHTADMISYRGCGDCPYRSRAEYPYAGERQGRKLNEGFIDGDLSEANFKKLVDPDYAYSPYVRKDPGPIKKPAWLNEVIYYHNRGNSTFSGENSLLGDFFGLDDLFTEHPRVVRGMIDIYKEWIRKYRIDGFRVDTVKHVNIEFWQQFVPAMKDYAKSIGIPNFFIFGEVFSGDQEVLSHYMIDGGMDSVLDFAFQGASKAAVVDQGERSVLTQTFAKDDIYRARNSPQHLMNFVSNHDIGRIGYFLENVQQKGSSEEELTKRSILAHAMMYFTRGIPVLYYGDEQGFTGDGNDKDAREDMFPSQVKSYNDNNLLGTDKTTAVSNFDTSHPIFAAISDFSKLYSQQPLLQVGEQINLDIPHSQAQSFAFKRSLADQNKELLVFFNWSTQPADFEIDLRQAKALYPAAAQAPKGKKLQIPPLSFAIFAQNKAKLLVRNAKSMTVSQPPAGEKVAGLFSLVLDQVPEQVSKVAFNYQIAGEKASYPLPADFNAPFQVYIDGKKIKQGSKITVTATAMAGDKTIQSLQHSLVVDDRKPQVTLIYENGNQRSWAMHASNTGRLSLYRPLTAKDRYSFVWPNKTESALVIFGNEDEELEIDRPIYVSYEKHIKPFLKEKGDQLLVTLYANNLGKLSASPFQASAQKPSSLRTDQENQKVSLNRDLFLRGGMNTWQAQDEFDEEEINQLSAEVELSPGLIEFKVADKDWTATSNFGSPINETGLSNSAQSGNLSVQIDETGGGEYRFDFIQLKMPDSETKTPLRLVFIRRS